MSTSIPTAAHKATTMSGAATTDSIPGRGWGEYERSPSDRQVASWRSSLENQRCLAVETLPARHRSAEAAWPPRSLRRSTPIRARSAVGDGLAWCAEHWREARGGGKAGVGAGGGVRRDHLRESRRQT